MGAARGQGSGLGAARTGRAVREQAADAGQGLGDLRGRRVAVLGLGMSNIAVIQYLARAGAVITACDRKTRGELGEERYHELGKYPMRLVLGPDYLRGLEGQEFAFLTPGLRRDLPELLSAARAGVVFSSEIGLFLAACPAPIVAVTGSAGKTTTTSLVGLMLQASRDGVWVGGNIGRPLVADLDQIGPESLVVLELSSFQLQDLTVSPHIGAVLNVRPNHLDIHPTMEHYVDAKRNIYRYQGKGDWCVFNYDNEITRQMAREYDREIRAKRGAHPPVVYSRLAPAGDGAYLSGQSLTLRLKGYGAGLPDGVICRRGEVKLLGEHNLENVLAAALLAGLAGAGLDAIRAVATTFRGVEHRLEPVRELSGVKYYNDSKATVPDETIAAVRSLDGPIVLILGGHDKRIGFAGLAEEILRSGKVKTVILNGATAGLIDRALTDEAGRLAGEGIDHSMPEVLTVTGPFDGVVTAAAQAAVPGDTVVLSPACASFDQFVNFEERGRVFKELVRALPEKAPGA